MFCHVSAQAFNLITLNMNQFSTFFTLAMIAALIIRCLTLSYVLKAGTVCTFYHIFLNQTIFSSCRYIVVVPTAISRSLKYSLISCTVTCCPCTDCRKVCYSVICFILISGFCHFDLSFSIWKSFLNYLH